MRGEPLNVTYLAAELVAANAELQASPARAAFVATELCHIGRSYKAVSERLANGLRDWRGDWDERGTARAERRRDALRAKAELLVSSFRGVTIEGESLHLSCRTPYRPGSRCVNYRETTLL